MSKTPNEFLTHYSRKYPNVWKIADDVRQKRGTVYPDWPSWFFLPIVGWSSIAGVRPDDLSTENLMLSNDVNSLAALGAWRYTQDIYTFHPDILSSLLKTKLSGNIPVNVVMRMPQWCMYIDLSGYDNLYSGVHKTQIQPTFHGFFVYLESHDIPGLRFALNITNSEGDDILNLGPIIFLGEWSIEEVMQKLAFSISQKTEHKTSFICTDAAYINLATDLLNITLYLCSEYPDITGGVPGIYPRYPTPKKQNGACACSRLPNRLSGKSERRSAKSWSAHGNRIRNG
jgi:hypothetical protein